MINDAARNAWHLLNRLEAAVAGTRQMVEDEEFGAAYQNLDRIEKLVQKTKPQVSQAMTERRWDHGERPRP